MTTTQVSQLVRAPRASVYRALLDPVAVQQWMVPDSMTSKVHEFNAVEGGRFRISLTYADELADQPGKSGRHTDTFHGVFTRLDPDREVVQEIAFETDDPTMQGTMVATYSLTDAEGGGTLVAGFHEGLPAGVSPADNEAGWRMSLQKLARLVEGQSEG